MPREGASVASSVNNSTHSLTATSASEMTSEGNQPQIPVDELAGELNPNGEAYPSG